MATLGSRSYYGLIERLIAPRRPARLAPFDPVSPEPRPACLFGGKDPPKPEVADDAWLRRSELRGSRQVVELLERHGFGQRPGWLHALFVDTRCGLIEARAIGPAAAVVRDRSDLEVLKLASASHANGVILATHDLGGEVSGSPRYCDFITRLQLKGDAIEVFLLDHFVLTRAGWRRMAAAAEQERRQ